MTIPVHQKSREWVACAMVSFSAQKASFCRPRPLPRVNLKNFSGDGVAFQGSGVPPLRASSSDQGSNLNQDVDPPCVSASVMTAQTTGVKREIGCTPEIRCTNPGGPPSSKARIRGERAQIYRAESVNRCGAIGCRLDIFLRADPSRLIIDKPRPLFAVHAYFHKPGTGVDLQFNNVSLPRTLRHVLLYLPWKEAMGTSHPPAFRIPDV
jgi:hypothetical protein